MDCPWQWQTDTQIALFLAWASFLGWGAAASSTCYAKAIVSNLAMLLLLEPTGGVIF